LPGLPFSTLAVIFYIIEETIYFSVNANFGLGTIVIGQSSVPGNILPKASTQHNQIQGPCSTDPFSS